MLDPQSVEFLRRFLRAQPARTALLIGLLFLAGLTEGLGIATVLPLLELGVAEEGHQPSAFSQAVADALHAIGVSPRLEVLLALVVLAMVLKSALNLLAMQQVGFTVSRITTNLRLSLIRGLLQARWHYFMSQPIGRFTNSLSGEAARAAAAYRAACTLMARLIQVVVYTVIVFLISWKIALFAIGAGVMVTLLLSRLVRSSRAASRHQTMLTRSMISRLTDALHGIKPIKAMSREGQFQHLLEGEARSINEASEQQIMASETMRSAREPLLVILLSVALYASVSMGGQSLAALFVLAFLFNRVVGRITALQLDYQGMVMAESAFWSMTENIESAEEQREESHAHSLVPCLSRGIELRNVSFSYGPKRVLSGVSLTIHAGEFVAFVGPSGAGKTTIADLVVGLHAPTEGAVLIDGVSLAELDMRAWRQQIGYVPQEMFLFHDTVYTNVTLGDADIPREAVEHALKASGAWHFVMQLPEGLDTVLGERGSKLSGGQRQRIAIARALVREPRLLVLDEVTTSLDPRTEAAICDTLRELGGSVMIIAVSHQPAMMEAAGRIFRVDAGRITESHPLSLAAASS